VWLSAVSVTFSDRRTSRRDVPSTLSLVVRLAAAVRIEAKCRCVWVMVRGGSLHSYQIIDYSRREEPSRSGDFRMSVEGQFSSCGIAILVQRSGLSLRRYQSIVTVVPEWTVDRMSRRVWRTKDNCV
jgi:hypothetical protein